MCAAWYGTALIMMFPLHVCCFALSCMNGYCSPALNICLQNHTPHYEAATWMVFCSSTKTLNWIGLVLNSALNYIGTHTHPVPRYISLLWTEFLCHFTITRSSSSQGQHKLSSCVLQVKIQPNTVGPLDKQCSHRLQRKGRHFWRGHSRLRCLGHLLAGVVSPRQLQRPPFCVS